ncbi:MAG: HDOD domain-containing protein [Magnetococcales bacterium]|nr:HDOD domain-containing protein [Magnetococcales bacterium]NGZ27478.1 HDOD domain-containing protein [Magnetococcales bacterium]
MTGNHSRLVHMVERMPAFPKSVHRILKLTSDINCAPKEIVGIIDHDPVMTMKLLKLVNSAYFGLSKKVTSINHAVVLLGINTIKNLAVSIATLGVLPQQTQSGLHMNRFLLHSLGTATISKLLCRMRGVAEVDSNDYFVAGLLHDFGKVVLTQFMPMEHRHALEFALANNQSLHLAEQSLMQADFPINHCNIGAMLAEKWQLSPDLVLTIREHHNANPPDLLLLDCVIAANLIAKNAKFGYSGNPVVEELPAAIAQRFGHNLQSLTLSLGDFSQEMAKARSFLQLS